MKTLRLLLAALLLSGSATASRDFPNAAANYLESATPPATAAPFTMVAWALNDTVDGIFDTIVSIQDNATDVNLFMMQQTDTEFLRLRTIATVGGNAETTNGFTSAVWHHCAAVETSTTSRQATLDGATASKGTNTATLVPLGIDTLSVGLTRSLTPTRPWDGRIGHVAVWNVALTDQDLAALAIGISPLRMKRENLVFYSPINGNHSPETDLVGGRNLTVNGTLTKQEEPPVPFSLIAL